jgi:hypothetical protein
MEIPATELDKISPVSNTPISIITINDILNTLNVIVSNETADKQHIQSLIDIDEVDLRKRLVDWGIAGFPVGHVIYSLQFTRLENCSDGVVRNDLLDYIQFLFPETSIAIILGNIESKLPGMTLSYSYTNDLILRIHVSRK